MPTATDLEPLGKKTGVAPDDRLFAWGPIVATHTVGRFQIVEFLRDNSNVTSADPDRLARQHGQTQFQPYIDGGDTNRSYDTLEQALVGAITIVTDGWSSRADSYIFSMLGMHQDQQ